jgi:hypothetical protein
MLAGNMIQYSNCLPLNSADSTKIPRVDEG